MENIKILVNKIKRLISSSELNLNDEKVVNELYNQIRIMGLDLDDLINWHSVVVLKNNNIQTAVFVKDKKRLEIYLNKEYHIDYYDETKEVKSTFNFPKKDDLCSRKIKVMYHFDKYYLFNIGYDSNFYGQSFNSKLGVMRIIIRCFNEKVDLNNYESFKYDLYNNIEFVLPGNYIIDDLVKLIRIFELNPNVTMQYIKEVLSNPNISKEIRYISYNESRDFKFSNGKYYIDIHTLPISEATLSGGKIYEIDGTDLTYFGQLNNIDYDRFTPWRYQKERKYKNK